MSWEYFQINFRSIYVCQVYPDEMCHFVHGQWRGCSTEAWKKHRKEIPEIHEEKNLATWDLDVPDDSTPNKRLLAKVNREFCRRRLMHRPNTIQVHSSWGLNQWFTHYWVFLVAHIQDCSYIIPIQRWIEQQFCSGT